MKKLLILLAGMTLLFLGTIARADIIYEDPSTIHINNGTTYLFSGEVVPLTNPSTISLVGSAGVTISDVFLVLATPGDTDVSPATVSGAGSGTYKGDLTSGQDVYNDTLGLSAFHPDGSESFVNFTLYADQSATNFDIWTYDLGKSLSDISPVTVTFLSGPPVGTYVFAYGFTTKHNGPHTTITLYDTAFTNAGLEQGPPTQVPEPTMLMLFGSGLVILGIFGRKRFKA
jgi:hypothetical protein